MKFKFALQSVVKHRKIIEDLAQKDFMEAQAELIAENEKLIKMKNDLHESHLRMGELQAVGGQQGPSLSQIHDFKKGQDVRIARQQHKIQEIEKLVEDKREILRQAAVEYKIIEKLREKRFEEYKFDRNIEEQHEADEQSILRFGRNSEKMK